MEGRRLGEMSCHKFKSDQVKGPSLVTGMRNQEQNINVPLRALFKKLGWMMRGAAIQQEECRTLVARPRPSGRRVSSWPDPR
jgi:hypothetical protein